MLWDIKQLVTQEEQAGDRMDNSDVNRENVLDCKCSVGMGKYSKNRTKTPQSKQHSGIHIGKTTMALSEDTKIPAGIFRQKMAVQS
ncbi:hypothetical protein RRG08_029401 [Elysia crispata]|uniref:Uncharacterized protein n=1 Tax=Elysia crispata TaxID=231223 RepID=A0AAE0YZY1_9GAST|nr:hypothetical protein RRG08_029401 [Elysia crispata]